MTNAKAFASINLNLLSDVSGGGHRRHHGGQRNVSIVNNYAAAPAVAAVPAAPSNSGVSVNVGYA